MFQTPALRDKLSINPEDRIGTGDTPQMANQIQKQVNENLNIISNIFCSFMFV